MNSTTRNTITNYVLYGYPMGDFMTAVFKNDLFESFGMADIQNRHDMFEIVSFINAVVPMDCRGENIERWIKVGGVKGRLPEYFDRFKQRLENWKM